MHGASNLPVSAVLAPPSLALLPLSQERKESGDTVIHLPVTEEFNGVGSRMLECSLSSAYIVLVGNHGSSISCLWLWI